MIPIYHDKRSGLYLPNSARPKASGYGDSGASLTHRTLKGFRARSGSPVTDIDWNNATLRQRARMLYMSSPLATSAVNTNRTKAVGVGLTLKSMVDRETLNLSPEDAKAWQQHTEREFSLWADSKDNCDATGMNNFYSIQQLALVSWLMSGDAFALLKRCEPEKQCPYALRIHLIEADRVRTPMEYGGTAFQVDARNPDTGNRIFDGVEVDGNGKVIAFYIHDSYPWEPAAIDEKWERVEARGQKTGLPNVLQMMSSERPDQYRGVSLLAQAIEPILQLRRYTESALEMAHVQSCYTAWILTETDPDEIPFNETGSGDVVGLSGESPLDPSARTPNELGLGPGTINVLDPRERVEFGNPNMPVASFDSFIKTYCRLIGASVGIPYDVLTREYNSSYSAARAALLDAWEDFRMRRRWFVDDFCQPVYEVWLAEAVARGRIKAPGFFDDPLVRAAWCGAKWIGPVPGSIDPRKEADAAILQIQHGLKTHEQVTRETGGGDWWENIEQLRQENEKLAEACAPIAAVPSTVEVSRDEPDEEET